LTAAAAIKSGSWDVARIVATVAVKNWVDPAFDKLNGYVYDYIPDGLSLLLSATIVVVLGNILFLLPRVVFTWSDADRVPLLGAVHGLKVPPEAHRFELKMKWEGGSVFARIIQGIVRGGQPFAEVTLEGRALQVVHHKSAPSNVVLVRTIQRGVAFDLDFASGGQPRDWSNCVVTVVDAPSTDTVGVHYRVVAKGWFRNGVARLILMSPNLSKFQVNRVS
jgi:hypothetical protein